MPTLGHFVLHSRAEPPLTAGDYVLRATQQVAGGPTEPYQGHVRITSPRYRMPPDQILSTFPPANAEGAFEARLPQVVLRRRTLPWERVMDDAHREIPWLALVVIAEGEGQLSGEVPIAECVTPGVTLSGPNDVASGVYLAVSETVVNKVFPTRDDLQLLVHVREVDINDTELAIGDDDGFLAVVLANRLPQFDREQCRPVRYLACLINLEGQLAMLPSPPGVVDDRFHATAVVQDLRALAQLSRFDPDQRVMGKGVRPALANSGDKRIEPRAPARATTPRAGGATAAKNWRTSPADIESIAVSATPAEAARLVRDAMGEAFRHPVEYLVPGGVRRFPVLAHWSFTCMGAGSFRTLMQGLDVGLLGTLPADPLARPRPECAPPQKGDAPPPAPPARPLPEATETGHVGLEHLTRRGDRHRAWYRGPLSLHFSTREAPDENGRLILAHTSDQLRRIVPDGREDLSLAAAFEIGRLLALSQPSVVAALMRWRGEQFGAERARRLAALALEGLTVLAPAVGGAVADLGQLVGRAFVIEAAKAPEKVLAPSRPLADPGRPLTFLTGELDEIVANGFGIPLARVRELSNRFGMAGALATVPVPVASGERFDRPAADALRQKLAESVAALTTESLGRGPRSRVRADKRDALDELIEKATRNDEEPS
jgi:hypothetical protein